MNKLNTVTVGELREMLEEFPVDMPVVFAHPSHDYWHTELAGEISNIDYGNIKWSEYHRQFKTIFESDQSEDDIPLEDDPDVSRAIVIC